MTNNALPNIPWQERPAGSCDVVWRYDANPIIPRNLIPSSNSIFNSASGLALLVLDTSLQQHPPRGVVSSLFLILTFWSAVCFYLGLLIPGLIGVSFVIYILKATGGHVWDFSIN